jgi:general stress protein 26
MSSKRVEKLRELVEDIEVAMLTTRTKEGHLVSRPMALQKDAPGADFWFVTSRDTGSVEDIRGDPHVNLAFYKDRTREYVSVAGSAFLTDDRELIRRLYAPDWKIWFEDKGGALDGSADDPRFLLIGVRGDSAHYLSVDKPQVLVLVEFVKGMLSGKAPDLGETRELTGSEVHRAMKD